jgi:hypothetical protein
VHVQHDFGSELVVQFLVFHFGHEEVQHLIRLLSFRFSVLVLEVSGESRSTNGTSASSNGLDHIVVGWVLEDYDSSSSLGEFEVSAS